MSKSLSAMTKVEELAQEDGFGTLRKTRIVYNDKGQTIDTYQKVERVFKNNPNLAEVL